MLEPTNGWAFIAGSPAGTVHARAALSYLPDNPVLYDDLSLGEHIEYIARLHKTVDWQDYADDLVDMFGLGDRIDDLPSRFSRGLKQKTGLILGLIRPFTVMLVDEPFVGLDTPGQETLVEIMSDVVAQGATIICSTHQLDLVPSATRCVGLRDGELAYDGPATAAKIRELVGGE
jgi:ABC-type multidrug transport system ATPase subunit